MNIPTEKVEKAIEELGERSNHILKMIDETTDLNTKYLYSVKVNEINNCILILKKHTGVE